MSIPDRSRALAMSSASIHSDFFPFFYFLLFWDYFINGEAFVENGNWKTSRCKRWRQRRDDSGDSRLSAAPHTHRSPAEKHRRPCTWRDGLTKCFSLVGSREWPLYPPRPSCCLHSHPSLPHLNLWRPSVKCAGHGKREIIWDKLSPQWRSLPACSHTSSGHLSEDFMQGGGRYCSI